MIFLGYLLPSLIDPLFKRLVGESFEIRDHIEKVIIVVVLLSVSPAIIPWLRSRWNNKTPSGGTKLAA